MPNAPTKSTIKPPAEVNPRTDPVLDFPYRSLGEMRLGDYDAIGFLGGLEVHQQLETRRKLFCRCPAGRYVDRWDAEVLRHMRPTLSELGEYDGTALMEYKTRKEIVYQLERGTVCTYEIDDTPPFPIDPEAVEIALEISALLSLQLVSELHVMRKQYLDGSIPTGFQRTAMVGLGGALPFVVPELGVGRELRIRQLSLEEDACREIADRGHRVTFRTDRLGMPLTETVTEPELRTPWEVGAAGRIIADVARMTGRVRRGPGAARQDVNVSVAGGRRVEIKGVDNHRGIPLLVHVEAFRQLNLLRIRAELRRRGITPTMLTLPDNGLPWEVSALVANVTEQFRGRRAGVAGGAVGDRVVAVRLPGFAGMLAHPTQPGLAFAHEFAERVRVIACPAHAPFMSHSDGDAGLLDAREWRDARAAVGAKREDAVVVVWMEQRDAATAAREILLRGIDALAGVPAETRQAGRDGTTGFERILPGPDRMYPDTDTPPIPLADALVERIRLELPERPWDRERRYVDKGLRFAEARALARSPWAALFDALDPPAGEVARRVANGFRQRLTYHRRVNSPRSELTPARFSTLVRALADGTIRPEATNRVIDALVREVGAPTRDILLRFRERGDDPETLDRLARQTAARVEELGTMDPAARHRWAMGRVMPQLLGRVQPQLVAERISHALATPAGKVS
ncbi:MAG TPA: Glu-tRNA(Gln) amidotransferase subunit GatE [Gemmatimonadales bacterium]|jgi:glutamyl-tRNA(Gln) amidotransferase subunit E